MNRICLAVALGVLGACATERADAAYPEHCEWSTVYYTADGYPVQAHLILHGERGSYHTTQGNIGWLYDVTYDPAPNQPEGVTLITGKWRFENGQTGWFKFHVNPQWGRFSGIWGFTGSRVAYTWNGRRVRDDGPAPLTSSPPAVAPPRPSVTSQPPLVSPPITSQPPFPTGGGRPSGPPIIEPGQLSGGTQLKFENGQLKAFDSNGRFLGIVRQGRQGRR